MYDTSLRIGKFKYDPQLSISEAMEGSRVVGVGSREVSGEFS